MNWLVMNGNVQGTQIAPLSASESPTQDAASWAALATAFAPSQASDIVGFRTNGPARKSRTRRTRISRQG
jgi:hypothetical protein